MVDGGVMRNARIAPLVAGAMLAVLALAGAAQARSTSASDYSMVHLTKGKHKGEVVLQARVHMDRAVGRTCPVRVRIAGPTRRIVVIRGAHRTRAYERARDVLDLRGHMTRPQVRKVFGKRPAGKPARVTIVVGSRTDQCFAPGLRSAAGPAARSGPSSTTITLRPANFAAQVPGRAVFAPNGNSQVWLDVVWGIDPNEGFLTLVPFVQSLAVPDGTVRGCQPSDGPQIFKGVNPFPLAVPRGPSPAPPTGWVQTDGTFRMIGASYWSGSGSESAECWPSSTVIGTFSAVPNAQGNFPGSTTVTATWNAGNYPQSGTVSYPLQAQSSCSTFGPRRCS